MEKERAGDEKAYMSNSGGPRRRFSRKRPPCRIDQMVEFGWGGRLGLHYLLAFSLATSTDFLATMAANEVAEFDAA